MTLRFRDAARLERNWVCLCRAVAQDLRKFMTTAHSAFRADQSSLSSVPNRPNCAASARGFTDAEWRKACRGEQASARGALEIAALDQIGLDDVLDRIARLGQLRPPSSRRPTGPPP